MSQPLIYTQAEFHPEEPDQLKLRSQAKAKRHENRRAVGELFPGERVANCGQKAVGSIVSLHSANGNGHYGSVETCGSVWLCPTCAAKITEGRKDDVEHVLKGHRDRGAVAYMATLTVPHRVFQRCADLKTAVANAWRKVKTGKAWTNARNNYHYIGDIRAFEVTHGRNGWHPHLHILVFFDKAATPEQIQGFSDWLFLASGKAIVKADLGKISRKAFAWDEVGDNGAAEYVSKWGAALELTKAHVKRANGGGRTPWQILEDINSGASEDIERDKELFREYGRAFKGARQLTWSRSFKRSDSWIEPSLRERYAMPPEKTDEELAEEITMEDSQVASMDRALFHEIVKYRATASSLTALEETGVPGFARHLTNIGIPWHLEEIHGLKEGTTFPLFRLCVPHTSLTQTPEQPDKVGKVGFTQMEKTYENCEKTRKTQDCRETDRISGAGRPVQERCARASRHHNP